MPGGVNSNKAMLYQISHRTLYTYDSPVTVAHYIARLEPRPLPTQTCPWHEIVIRPRPACRADGRTDAFGNTGVYFEVEGTHGELEVVARSFVRLKPRPLPDPAATPPWESVRDACAGDHWNSDTAAAEFIWPSPLIPPGEEFRDYAAPSFPPGRPVLDGVCDLNSRIFRDFTFDPEATNVATPVSQSFTQRRGVCQDFAHVMIACLRSLGLPARYVSGYLETVPPPGQEKLIGADASHAWLAAWCGEIHGWIDADPTNDLLPTERHITVSWGRDFADVSPLTGVSLGSGKQKLTVGVDVMAVEE
jgi:transglutaminase-like putative cysteine protease